MIIMKKNIKSSSYLCPAKKPNKTTDFLFLLIKVISSIGLKLEVFIETNKMLG